MGKAVPVSLAGSARLGLSVIQQYRVIEDPSARGPWTVLTESYYYVIECAHGSELFAYHWHPSGPSPIVFPHLHLGADVARQEFATVHLPTGRIILDQVLRLVISELGVRPLRRDWATILSGE